eukprot:TRINITY_DN11727_c0_g1_i1.p1 TRINITY_DN11727_c0_g1~~TRINITY_DN11727_c0_g1_i1.p1  ORF type:complete len:360 (+),score=33.39 TRINITY_DN11727_c0_g1_i1:405-1484(+)
MEEREKHPSSSAFNAPFQGWPAVTAPSYDGTKQCAVVEPIHFNSDNPQSHRDSMFAPAATVIPSHPAPPLSESCFPSSSSSHSQYLGYRDLIGGTAPLCFGYGQRNGSQVLPLRADLLCGLNSAEQNSVLQVHHQPLLLSGKMMTPQEMVEAKALAASKSHSEAERRRRERINNHLATLRSLLPNTTKTDKASLLAEVIEHVKELKRLVEDIGQKSPVPSEADEVSVDHLDEEGRLLLRASLCCEDRPDLLTDLIKTLRTLRLRTVKAEMATLGGRVKNVFVVTSGSDSVENPNTNDHPLSNAMEGQESSASAGPSVSSLQEALKAVLEKHNLSANLTNAGSGSNTSKRQRQVGQFSSS